MVSYGKCTFNPPSGQFYHGIDFEVTDLRPGEVPEKPDATMYVKGHELTVTRCVNCCVLVLRFMCVAGVIVTLFPGSTEAGRETSGVI